MKRLFCSGTTGGWVLLSKRAWIIYSLFFIPPFIITLAWLFIPLQHYSTYSVAISIYYCVVFIAWINFNNVVMPGCPLLFMVLSFLAFAGPLAGYLASYANHSDRKDNKLSYTVIHVFTFATTSLCYLAYVVRYKLQKHKYSRQEKYADKDDGVKVPIEQPTMSSKIAYAMCFISTIDDPEIHKWVSYKGSYTPQEENIITWKNWFIIVLYQAVVVGTWIWLQGFTDLVIFQKEFDSSFGALASIVIFQTSKIILIGLCGFVNSLLPPTPFDSIAHFTLFQLQISFLLYYRTLFMSFSGWPQTILVALVTLVFDIGYYPIRMLFPLYNFRYVTLKIRAEVREYDKKYPRIFNFLFSETLTYEETTNITCIEYYYEKIAEYYSIISTVVFISILRQVDYHADSYISFTRLDEHNYHLLLWRYLFLFGFETITDFLLRLFVKHKMGIDISNKGRNYTIANYITRFLFTTFMIYDLITVYYSQINTKF